MNTIDWSDILGSDSDSDLDCGEGHLGSPPRLAPSAPPSEFQSDFSMLVTLNYPRTVGFLRASSQVQKELYKKLLHDIKNFNGMIPYNVEYVFEYCKSGQVHLHALLQYKTTQVYCIGGLISDFVKNYLKNLPKKYSLFKEGCMFYEYQRYRAPQIAVQYKLTEDEYIEKWRTYMHKEIYNKNI